MAALVYAVFGFMEFLLAFRLIFQLTGASADSPFVAWVYSLSAPLVAPFAGIFGQPQFGQGSTLDVAALIALVVYGIIASLLVQIMTPRRSS